MKRLGVFLDNALMYNKFTYFLCKIYLMTNLEALYLTLFIVGFWLIFGSISLQIRKFLGTKLPRNGAFTLYAAVLLLPLLLPFIFGWL
tara:strand:- start:800 stop:1063 length:264 start_codon:yes stop_codon:yes gene_type:complete